MDDDFDTITWGRRRVDEFDDEVDPSGGYLKQSRPEVFAVDDDEEIDLEEDSERIRLARIQRQRARDGSYMPSDRLKVGRTDWGQREEIEVYDDDGLSQHRTSMRETLNPDISIDEDDTWEAALMSRMRRNMTSRAHEDVGRDVFVGHTVSRGYTPTQPIPSLEEALAAFERRAESKRVELQERSDSRARSEAEKAARTIQLQQVDADLRSALERLRALENSSQDLQ
jgi:hypothetical protein